MRHNKILCIFFLFLFSLQVCYAAEEISSNDILITRNTKETIDWKKKLIEQAQSSIEISGCYCGGDIFNEILQLIAERLYVCPKLQVHILSVGDLITSSNKEHIQKLDDTFPEQFHYIETSRRTEFFPKIKVYENHEKILVVDEKYFIIGGSNITDESVRELSEIQKISSPTFIDRFIGTGMCDTDALVSGPLAREVRIEFYRLWEKWKTDQTYLPDESIKKCSISEFDTDNSRVIRNVKMKFISGNPEDGPNNRCAQTLRQLFDTAQKTILIGNMVFDEEDLIFHLQQATQRDVSINIITNGNRTEETCIGKRLMGIANRRNFPTLSKNTVFYEHNNKNQVYHKKVTVIDKKITTIGSMNISNKSVFCDDESMLVLYSEAVAQEMEKILTEDMDQSVRLSEQELLNLQKGWSQLAGSIISWISRDKIN